jgi:hypothetical protein
METPPAVAADLELVGGQRGEIGRAQPVVFFWKVAAVEPGRKARLRRPATGAGPWGRRCADRYEQRRR